MEQPKCPSTDEWIKKMWYVYRMEYHSAMIREDIWPCAKKTDGSWERYTEQDKSERERQVLGDLAYMQTLKQVKPERKNKTKQSEPVVTTG